MIKVHTEPLVSRFGSLRSGRGIWPYCMLWSLCHGGGKQCMENEWNDDKEWKDEKNGECGWPTKETHFCWSIAN